MKAAAIFLGIGLSVGSAAAAVPGQVGSDVELAVGDALLLGCLNVTDYQVPLSKYAEQLKLQKASGEDRLKMTPDDQVWQAPIPSGRLFVVESPGASHACSVFAFGVPAESTRAYLEHWLIGPGAPFVVDTAASVPANSKAYRWKRDGDDIGAMLSTNPNPGSGAPDIAATLFREN